jgi:hypothetical protein
MASSLPLKSIFLDLPGAQERVPKLPILGFVKNYFAHKWAGLPENYQWPRKSYVMLLLLIVSQIY